MLHALPLLLSLVASPAHAARAAGDSVRSDLDVRLVAMRHATEVQRCYETQGLKVNPSLTGTLEVELHVLPSGRVDSVAVSASSLAGAGKREVEGCVLVAVHNWRFERGAFQTETIVYPFALRPREERQPVRSS